MLAEEAALTAHNLLLPLTARREPPAALLAQPLGALRLGLGAIRGLRPPALAGQAAQRAAAAQGLAAVTYDLLRLVSGEGRGWHAGGGATELEARLAALDAELLGALAPPPAAAAAAAPAPAPAAGQGGSAPEPADGAAAGKVTAPAPLKGKRAASATGKDATAKPPAASAPPPGLAPAVPDSLSGSGNSAAAWEAPAKDDTAAVADAAADATRASGTAALAAVQDAVLRLPVAKALSGGPVAARLADGGDLAAAVLSRLGYSADPLGVCWPLLAAEGAAAHPCWLELGVRVLEAAAAKGKATRADPRLQEAAEQLLAHARLAARVPQACEWERGWRVDAAAEQLAAEAAAAGGGDHDVQQQAAADAQEGDERRRLAAGLLLQRRLPALLRRLRHMRETRGRARAWAPWLTRLHTLLGHVAADQALQLLAARDAGAAGADSLAPAVLAASSSSPTDKKGAAGKATAGAAKKPGGKAGGQAAADAGGAPAAGAASAADAAAAETAARAVRCFSRAAVLAGRAAEPGGAAWPVLLNAVRALWDVGRQLVNALPQLAEAAAAGTDGAAWQLQPLPPPRLPPLALESLLPAAAGEPRAVAATPPPKAGGKGGGGGGSAESKKALGRAPSAAAGAKGGRGTPAAGDAQAGPRLVPQPVARRPAASAAPAAAAAAEALLAVVARVKARMAAGPPAGALRSPPPPGAAQPTGMPSSHGGDRATEISLGSDAPSIAWYESVQLSVPWLGGVVAALLEVLRRSECWHAVMGVGAWQGACAERCWCRGSLHRTLLDCWSLSDAACAAPAPPPGRRWLELTDGQGAEGLLPLLLEAAPRVGADPAPAAAALDAVLRDKNQALAALDKVGPGRRLGKGAVWHTRQGCGCKGRLGGLIKA
jgi:hypothetical protein